MNIHGYPAKYGEATERLREVIFIQIFEDGLYTTKSGVLRAYKGDYMIAERGGKTIVLKPDSFKAQYRAGHFYHGDDMEKIKNFSKLFYSEMKKIK